MFKIQVEPKPQASGFTAKFHFLWSIRVKTMEWKVFHDMLCRPFLAKFLGKSHAREIAQSL